MDTLILMKYLGFVALIVVVVVGGLVIYRTPIENSSLRKPSSLVESEDLGARDVEIATDPSFPQLIGGYYEQVPKMPIYPDAVLVGSAKTNQDNMKDTGYRVLWKSKASVPEVMKWTTEQYVSWGWDVDELGDPSNTGEQVVGIANKLFTGTLSAEHESENETKIIVQILYK